jgi:hypothetical protein
MAGYRLKFGPVVKSAVRIGTTLIARRSIARQPTPKRLNTEGTTGKG